MIKKNFRATVFFDEQPDDNINHGIMENIVHPTSPIALKHLQIKIKRRGIAKGFSWTVCSNNILFYVTLQQGNKIPASLCIGADISKIFKIFEKV